MYVAVGKKRKDRYGKSETEETRYYLCKQVVTFGNTIGITYVDGKDGLITKYERLNDLEYTKIYDDIAKEDK